MTRDDRAFSILTAFIRAGAGEKWKADDFADVAARCYDLTDAMATASGVAYVPIGRKAHGFSTTDWNGHDPVGCKTMPVGLDGKSVVDVMLGDGSGARDLACRIDWTDRLVPQACVVAWRYAQDLTAPSAVHDKVDLREWREHNPVGFTGLPGGLTHASAVVVRLADGEELETDAGDVAWGVVASGFELVAGRRVVAWRLA